jgi:hypothetical protein
MGRSTGCEKGRRRLESLNEVVKIPTCGLSASHPGSFMVAMSSMASSTSTARERRRIRFPSRIRFGGAA